MIAANYTVNLYCDCDECTGKQWGSPDFAEYIGNSWSGCAVRRGHMAGVSARIERERSRQVTRFRGLTHDN